MESLEFSNLPLIEVSCNLKLAEQRVLGWDEIAEVRNSLKDRLPLVTDFFSGLSATPIAFVLGTAPGAAFESNSGAKLEVRPDRISSSWRLRDSNSKYVRFKELYDCLDIAEHVLGAPPVGVVNMGYVNRAPFEHGQIHELINEQVFPGMFAGHVKDYNVAWDLDSGVEFRLTATPSEHVAVISTVAGIKSEGDWRSELFLLHSTLQEQFLSVITEKAKQVWALKTL